MGGRMQHRQSGLWGGLLGGIIITLLLLMINLGLVTEFEHIQSVALPTLLLKSHFTIIRYSDVDYNGSCYL